MQYNPTKFLQRHRLNITVIFLYLLFTLIFTFPLFLHISTSTPFADGSGDQFQSMWTLWWFKTALLKLQTNFLYTNFMYYPHGTSLVYHVSVFLGLLALPFQYLFDTPSNLIVSHNVILIFTFVFSAFGGYLLTKYLIKDRVTAFICGLLFAFCPYRLWHLNHLNLLSTEWIPFYILFLIKSVDDKSFKNFLWAGIFFVLTFLSSLTYALFLALFTSFYLLYLLVKSRDQLFDKTVLRNSFVAVLAVITVLSPLLYSLWSSRIGWAPTEEVMIRAGANLLGYFMPVKETSLLGHYFLPSRLDYHGISGGEVFLGYVLLFFMVYTWIRLPRERVKFWFLSSLAFMVLSLGQAIQIYDHSYHFKWLPYGVLHTYVPLFHMGRTPCRFSVMVTVCLIIFSSYGLMRFFRDSATQTASLSDVKNFFRDFLVRKGMPVVIVMLVCLEFIVFPTTLIKVEIPECYTKIKNAQEDCAILELPVACSGYSLMCNVRMFYQTFHGKRVVNGYLSRPSYRGKDFLSEILSEEAETVPGKVRFGVNTAKLAKSNVKYVVVHETEDPRQAIYRPLGEKIQDMGCVVMEEDSSRIKIVQLF